MSNHHKEIEEEKRFEFGKNWQRFLSVLNEERIAEAERSIKGMLEVENLNGKTFLDIGSGSGLFSMCAMRLGAEKVQSFDYDPKSVACTKELKSRYFPDDARWTIEEGSVLNKEYLSKLGQHDIVYSWGVLHHTGNMWEAMENVIPLIKPGGKLYIAIYNTQLSWTPFWTKVKRAYVSSNRFVKFIILSGYITSFVTLAFICDIIGRQNPLKRYRMKKQERGMSMFHDWIDWIGGYPFETAKPDEVFEFYKKKGFVLEKMATCYGGSGNNEFVFKRI